MEYIAKQGLRAVFASDVPQLFKRGDMRGTVCITFDDGFASLYTHAFPILKKYDIRVTVFLITGRMGGLFTNSEGFNFDLLGLQQISEMKNSGLIEFMPHSHTHSILTSLSLADVKQELENSRGVIQDLIGRTPEIFAYPKGKFTADIARMTREEGFLAAFSIRPGLVQNDEDLFALPRNAVDSATTWSWFRIMLTDSLNVYTRLRSLVR